MGIRKLTCLRVALLGAVVLVALSACSPVVIPDPALEQALRAQARRPLSLFLTQQDLRRLTTLEAPNRGIVNLKGLEYCENLITLNLHGNSIISIDPLKNLTDLSLLDLGDNRITDIKPIAGLLYLTELDLSGAGNVIINWSHLAANVENRGLGAGAVVRVPCQGAYDSEGLPTPAFKAAHDAMVDAGVLVTCED